MPFIVELGGKYCLWSRVSDSPATYLMTEGELFDHLVSENPYLDREGFEMRMARVRNDGGCSGLYFTKQDLIDSNRAGPNQSHVETEAELIALYTAPT